jgi:hypothetical protein
MIYDVVMTTTFKNGKTFVEETSLEAPSMAAAVVFTADGIDDGSYKPPLKGDDEGTITINAKAAVNNKPTYHLQTAAVWDEGKDRMIIDWDPIYK